jgi:hypothetical protein
MDAINGTDFHTGGVFGCDTRFSDHVCHNLSLNIPTLHIPNMRCGMIPKINCSSQVNPLYPQQAKPHVFYKNQKSRLKVDSFGTVQ